MFIALAILGCLFGLLVYAQVGHMLANWWKDRRGWEGTYSFPIRDQVLLATILWPLYLISLYALLPAFKGFGWLVAAPNDLLEDRRHRKQVAEDERRRKIDLEAKARSAEARAVAPVINPAAEITKINDDLVRLETQRAELLARKAELERRPDAARA